MLKIAYLSAITLAAMLKTRSARRLARCLLPAFLCAHIFIKRETSGYEAGSVHGLGKWCAKLRTGKFRPGIALPFVRISSIYWKTTANTNFRLEYSAWKNRTTFSAVPLLPEIFRWNDQRSHVPF